MSGWAGLKVDILKVIQNFVEMYPYPATDCLIIESIANCLDARASRIDIGIYEDERGAKIYKIVDNGAGMTKKEFEDNYHALSISSKAKGDGIGFAGVGSKLYLVFLSAGERITTETRSADFHSASQITVIDNEPKWAYIDKRTLFGTGTRYEVKLNEADSTQLTQDKITQIVQSYYNAILLGRYGNVVISYKGEPIKPWKPDLVDGREKRLTFRIRAKEFQLHLWLTKEELLERQGLEIVVFGKKIRDNQWFELDYLAKSDYRKRITGQIFADGLAQLMTTNKCDFRVQAGPALWGSFRRKAYDAFSDWLDEIGAMEETRIIETDPQLESMCKKLEREINQLLRDPVFHNFNPFLKAQPHPTLIEEPTGDTQGQSVEGSQTTEGTVVGPSEGGGIFVAGPNNGASIIESPDGNKQGTVAPRRIRHGIAINLKDEGENPKESWLTSEALVINTGHPVFMKSQTLGYPAETQHILRCVFFTLIEYNPPQTFAETLGKLREFYIKWATI